MTLSQLKTKVRKEFDEKFNEMTQMQMEDAFSMWWKFLDTQISLAYQTAIKDTLSKVPKKIPQEQISFWIKQKGSKMICAGCGEVYICNCKGFNKAIDLMKNKLEEII